MAALMPLAESSYSLRGNDGKPLTPYISDSPLKDRETRMKWLIENVGLAHHGKEAKVETLKLDDLLPPSEQIKKRMEHADLIVVTSQEIDLMGEQSTEGKLLARSVMESIIQFIVRGIRVLSNLGCEKIILTTDHGFIFGEDVEDHMKITSPGGNISELHRRIWIGQGGIEDPAFFRQKGLPFGVNDDIEVAVPWGFGVFKAKGSAGAYFHGGMSPQELIIPLLELSSKGKQEQLPSIVKWDIIPLKETIITRVFTVKILGTSSSFDFIPPKIRLEMRDSKDEKGSPSIAEPFDASYGFDDETKEIQLKTRIGDDLNIEVNEIRLVLIREPKSKSVDIQMIDTSTGVNIKIIKNIRVNLSI